MARFGVVGDLHGNIRWAQHVLDEMGKRKISHVFVVGDFGLWPGFSGIQYLDRLQESAVENNLSVLAIPGNHEWYDGFEAFQKVMPTHKGFVYLRERVLMSPKANSFKLFGKQFAVAGGAVSVDKDWRLAKERGGTGMNEFGWSQDFGKGTGPRTLWWPQEQLTDAEEEQVKKVGKVDILLTHDCSDRTPFHGRLKPDLDSMAHRQRIDRVLRAVQPEVHFHGHMHSKYDWMNLTGDDHWTQTYGLECDGDDDSWGIFDTDTMEFAFQGEGMQFRSLED